MKPCRALPVFLLTLTTKANNCSTSILDSFLPPHFWPNGTGSTFKILKSSRNQLFHGRPFFVEFRWLHQLRSTSHENVQTNSVRRWYGTSNQQSEIQSCRWIHFGEIFRWRMEGAHFFYGTASTYPWGIKKSDQGWRKGCTFAVASPWPSQTTTRENRETGYAPENHIFLQQRQCSRSTRWFSPARYWSKYSPWICQYRKSD